MPDDVVMRIGTTRIDDGLIASRTVTCWCVYCSKCRPIWNVDTIAGH